jgi:hypothetical protein
MTGIACRMRAKHVQKKMRTFLAKQSSKQQLKYLECREIVTTKDIPHNFFILHLLLIKDPSRYA